MKKKTVTIRFGKEVVQFDSISQAVWALATVENKTYKSTVFNRSQLNSLSRLAGASSVKVG